MRSPRPRPRPTVRPTPSATLLATVLVALLALLTPLLATATSTATANGAAPAPWAADRDGARPPQTSDGVVGPVARWLPPRLRARGPLAEPTREWVAPGVHLSQWEEDTVRGRIRAHLLTVQWRRPGVSVDYGNAGRVRATATVPEIAARDRGVVGAVNGDFFDIHDTGAPIGVGVERARGLLHGRRVGWNSAFTIGRDGTPAIGRREVVTRIRQHPGIPIATLNAPNVPVDSIGVYTRAWGRAAGARVTDESRRGVRVVRVVRGRVVSNNRRLPRGVDITGTVLVGRGHGARRLRALAVGSRASLVSRVEGRPRMAITGNAFLVRDGVLEALDDRELHPRTAIGIDRDAGTILLLVVDGRQPSSRGYTMLELADAMVRLGADEALNLDGGGSSTLLARRTGLGVGIVNSPSDGVARRVANVVEVRYRRPR
ncbi:phosphodiester glycosidase family protein [Nocardioides dongxiaopingii]|uniref:phosphodiester glycosidase family protein n=1 Tax=Nocardioides dongxiaopingii TaxID=2576036 RepID=UPI0010C76301|nr:phosphodiester glycosidase family protein [Nocardioides dongxiaopingii]